MTPPARPLHLISSVQNPQVKRLVRLRNRREREAEGLVLVEGARELARAQAAGADLREVYLCPELYSAEASAFASGLLGGVQADLNQLARAAFEKVSGRENPDGVLGLIAQPRPELPTPGPDAVVVVLHGLEKPGNVGAILRTADSVGAAAVLVLGRGADPYSPNVIRASQGSLWTVPTLALDSAQALAWLRQHGFRLVACTPDAERDYWDAPLTGRVALLLGTEHEGLPAEWRSGQSDSETPNPNNLAIKIPMLGSADSLNVATAAALVLYETLRQRQAGKG